MATGTRSIRSVGLSVKMHVFEVIGRVQSAAKHFANFGVQSTTDNTKPNYGFYDRLRRGLATGFEQSGVLAQVISETLAAWTIGDNVQMVLAQEPAEAESETDPVMYTNDLIARFIRAHESDVQQMVTDWYALGDQYMVVQPDGSVAIPSPDTVDPEYDPFNPKRLLKVSITTKTQDGGTVVDTYTADRRVVKIKRTDKYARENKLPKEETLEFDNLIGEIPIVHYAFGRGANEIHGHPVVEPLYPHLDRYDNLIVKMEDGAEVMGNPIPVIEGAEDPQKVLEMNGDVNAESEQWDDEEGNTRSRARILWDRITGFLLGKGASFGFKSPQLGFTNDIRNTLKSIWILIMELSGIPEAHWGTEMGQSRSTSQEQTKGFEFRIRRYRTMLQGRGGDDVLEIAPSGGLIQLVWLWLKVKALTDKRVVVGELVTIWPELSSQDIKETRDSAKLAHDKGTITDAKLLELLQLVDDPDAEVRAARAEQDAMADPFDVDTANNLLADDEPEPEPEPTEDEEGELGAAA